MTGKVATGCVGTPPVDAPYRRVDGFLLADGFADLLDSETETALSVYEDGTLAAVSSWTGTSATGTLIANRSCDDWELPSNIGRYGNNNQTNGSWTNQGEAVCSGNKHLYCLSTEIVVSWDSFETNDLSRWSAKFP